MLDSSRFMQPAIGVAIWGTALLLITASGCGARPAKTTAAVSAGESTSPHDEQASAKLGDASEDRRAAANESKPKPAGPPKSHSDPGGAASSAVDGQRPPAHRNRLADETSPYLLMHAHNPVDWYPWGEEALAKAKRENKLIFLSVGYSSCHWCHVMERESFMDDEIAAFLNENFVCIKLDREERPDVDSIYMTALHALSQRGGWPLSMFLTPDAKPFFGGTYFPARDGDRGAQIGFLSVINRVHNVWTQQRADVENTATRLTEFVAAQLGSQAEDDPVELNAGVIEQIQEALAGQFDEDYGGFGFNPSDPGVPKFPEPSNLLFLIERSRDAANEPARKMLTTTLDHMAMGGIRDHFGGGFHRYSVDRFWNIPHFEKMLYDNGQLASAYARAYALTAREDYRLAVVELLDFVLREMTSPEGGFYSALDADSEGEEGKFYRWDASELKQLLTAEELTELGAVYGLQGPPNFENEFFVARLSTPLGDVAASQNMTLDQLESRLAPIRKKLLAAREKRARPLCDTKILTGWNGLMIRGMADAGRILQQPRYVEAAAAAAQFVLDKLRTPDGRLLRTYGDGKSKLNAYVDDYAFLADGLIALHEATGQTSWIEAADDLTQKQLELFWDDRNGGFFFTSVDHESLIARGKNPTDAERPAGNSVTASNMIYLARELQKPEYLSQAEKTIQSASTVLRRAPSAASRLGVAISELLSAKSTTTAPLPN